MKSQQLHKKIFEALEKFLAQTTTKCDGCDEIPELTDFKYNNNSVFDPKYDLKGWSRVSKADATPGGPIPFMSIILCPSCAVAREVSMPQPQKKKQ